MGDIFYTTREDVRRAVDAAGTARDSVEIDRANAAATHKINGALKRDFAPWTGTKYFDWPTFDTSVFRTYIDDDAQLVSLSALTSGGQSLDVAQVNLEPSLSGPPYDTIEVNRDRIGSFTSGVTFQRSVAATGVWGFDLNERAAGGVVGAVSSGATQLTLPDAVTVGVGSLIRLDSERMIVTDKSSVATGQSALTSLADEEDDRLLTVADGTVFRVGETITMDAERCWVDDILGNVLVLKRAVEGSLLSTHAGSPIYSPRLATVARGQLGTSAAAHSASAPIALHVFPALIRQYALAEILIELQLQASSYARTRPAAGGIGGRGIPISESGPVDVRAQAMMAFGRYGRARAI
jgi:hypothetical protein